MTSYHNFVPLRPVTTVIACITAVALLQNVRLVAVVVKFLGTGGTGDAPLVAQAPHIKFKTMMALAPPISRMRPCCHSFALFVLSAVMLLILHHHVAIAAPAPVMDTHQETEYHALWRQLAHAHDAAANSALASSIVSAAERAQLAPDLESIQNTTKLAKEHAKHAWNRTRSALDEFLDRFVRRPHVALQKAIYRLLHGHQLNLTYSDSAATNTNTLTMNASPKTAASMNTSSDAAALEDDERQKRAQALQTVLLPSNDTQTPSTTLDNALQPIPGYSVSEVSPTERENLQLYARFAAAAYCRKKKIMDWSCGFRCVHPTSPDDQPEEGRPEQMNSASFSGLDTPSSADVNTTTIVHEYFNAGFAATTGYIATDSYLRQILIVYRGSLAIQNYVFDLLSLRVPVTFMTVLTNITQENEPRVHYGFQESYEVVQEQVRNTTAQLLAAHPDYSIVLTGHSLGGVLAVMTALDLHKLMTGDPAAIPAPDPMNATEAQMHAYNRTLHYMTTFAALGPFVKDRTARNMSVYTYGQPKIGNAAFAEYVQSKMREGLSIYRVTAFDDIVPQLPPRWMNYTHIAGATELWIPRASGLAEERTLRCDHGPEDARCSTSLPLHSLVTHLFYWNVAFGPWC